MLARDVVKAAALLAARHAFPALPASLVRWSDEAQAQADGDYPQVTLSTISLVPEGPVSHRRVHNESTGALDVTLLQAYIWTVQVKTEGWKLESEAGNNPVLFTTKMRFGWYLEAVRAALLDPDSDAAEQTPIKVVYEVGSVLAIRQGVRGHTLPVHTYEIEFRYVDRDGDPTPVGILETAVLDGTLDERDVTISTES